MEENKRAQPPGDFAAELKELKELEDILAGIDADARKLVSGAAPRPVDGESEALRRELILSRESVANLMLRVSCEQRRARATALAVKRRLRAFRRSGKYAHAAEVKSELAEARATISGLLVEVSRRERRARAERLLRGRAARARKSAAPAEIPPSAAEAAVRAAAAASRLLDESLRELAAGDVSAAADFALGEGRLLARVLRLCAALSAAPPSGAGELHLRAALEARLDAWEAEFRRRSVTLVREISLGAARAAVPSADFDVLVDVLIGRVLTCAPRASTVLVRAHAPGGGSPRVDVQGGGPAAARIPETSAVLAAGGRLAGLDAALARDLAGRSGVSMIVSTPQSGRGHRLSLRFGGASGPE